MIWIEQALDWLADPSNANIVVTVLVVLISTVIYAFLRRRAMDAPEANISRRSRLRLLRAGIILVVAVVLLRVWAAQIEGADRNGGNVVVLESLFWTGVAAAAVWFGMAALRHALLRRAASLSDRHKIRLTTSWLGGIVFVVVAVFIWSRRIGDLSVFLGIVGAGLALSLQESVLSVVGWVLIVVKKPFDIGDRIEVDGMIGDVIDISVFHTSMMEIRNWVEADQSTGRMLIMPNSVAVRQPVVNYTKGFPFIWDEFTTIVTFESDWEAAKAIIQKEADEEADRIEEEVRRRISAMQNEYAIRYEHLRPIVYTTIADIGVQFYLRYLTPVRQRRGIAHRISEDVLREFLAHPDIDFAYPTTRFYRNDREGKPGTGGPTRNGLPPSNTDAEESESVS